MVLGMSNSSRIFFQVKEDRSTKYGFFLIDVKEVVDLLDSEVDVTLPKNIIVYYIVQNLPKEYKMFKHMLLKTQHLPPYNKLESMLISGELPFEMNTPNDAEATCSAHNELFFHLLLKNTVCRSHRVAYS